MILKKILPTLLLLGLFAGCADKNKLAQDSARLLFQETVNEGCQKQIKKNPIVALLLSNNQEDVKKVCGCVSEDVFNHVSANELLSASTNKEERKKIAIRAGTQSIVVCSKKLGYIK